MTPVLDVRSADRRRQHLFGQNLGAGQFRRCRFYSFSALTQRILDDLGAERQDVRGQFGPDLGMGGELRRPEDRDSGGGVATINGLCPSRWKLCQAN